MKHALLSLAFGILSVQAQASPLYYTFQGSVSAVSLPDHSIFAPDADVQYVFLVDQDLPGIALHHSVAFPLVDDPLLGSRFYFAEFISGTVEEVTQIAYGDKSYSGVERSINGSVTTTLRGSEDLVDGIFYPDQRRNQVSIATGSPIDSWFVGQAGFTGENIFPAWDGSYVRIASRLTLTGISDIPVPSVPEPSPFVLLFAGLALILLPGFYRAAGIARPLAKARETKPGYGK